jgi:hypothetical protein
MFFHTASECEVLARGYEIVIDAKANTIARTPPFPHRLRIDFRDQRARSYALAGRVVDWQGPFETCVMLVTEHGIWPSSENLHLYYAIRRSYGDRRVLTEAPGHVFLKHEKAELVTFLDLAVQFGWGCLIFKYPQDACLCLSHDEWMEFSADFDLDAIAASAMDFGLAVVGGDRPARH